MNYTWDEFEQRLITYRDVTIDLARILDAYELQIKELIQRIQLLTYEDSLPIFNQLYEIQAHLATAKFRYDLDLNEALDIFVYHFDRDDKALISQYWYKNSSKTKTFFGLYLKTNSSLYVLTYKLLRFLRIGDTSFFLI